VTINGAGVADIAGGLTFANGVTLGGSVTLLNQSDDALQQAGYLTLGAGASFVNAAGALWELVGNDGIALGAGSSAVVDNAGLIEMAGAAGTVGVAAAIANTGTLESASGTLDLQAAVTGSGDDIVQGASALEFDAAVSAGQTVTLTGGAGRLVLEDPAQFAATIDGFGGAEALDVNGAWSLLGFKENAGGTAGVLTFADGSARASIHLAGDYLAADFHVKSAGGFTVVTY
jgi:hypothetical protein